jgi:hypothetical protein
MPRDAPMMPRCWQMTIAQHIADWRKMFHSELDVKHLRNVAKKIAKNALTNGGYV